VHLCLSRAFDVLYLRAREFDRRLQKKSKIEFLFPHKQQNDWRKRTAVEKMRARASNLSSSLSLSVLRCARRELLLSESTDETCVTRAKREEKTTISVLFFCCKI
jgi:hypothetical protein